MFALYKRNSVKVKGKLESDYEEKLSAAIRAQRNGNSDDYSLLTNEAREIAAQIEDLRVSHSAHG